jgi:hypothetical protein
VYQEADGPIVTGEHATVAIELLDPELIQTASAAVDLDTVTRRFIGDLCEEALEDGSHESDLSTQAMVVAGSVRSFCHCQLPGVRAGGRGGRRERRGTWSSRIACSKSILRPPSAHAFWMRSMRLTSGWTRIGSAGRRIFGDLTMALLTVRERGEKKRGEEGTCLLFSAESISERFGSTSR